MFQIVGVYLKTGLREVIENHIDSKTEANQLAEEYRLAFNVRDWAISVQEVADDESN